MPAIANHEADSMSTPAVCRLTELRPGSLAHLHDDNLAGEDWALLSALGLSLRSEVRVCKAGNPWIVQVRSTRIGLADDVARQILVVPAARATP